MPHPIVQQGVRVLNDSLRVVLTAPIHLPPAQVVEVPEKHSLWASPMFQTLLGGALAVVGGVGTEMFRKWRGDHGERVTVTKAIETPLRELCELLGDWSRRHHRPEGVRLADAQECMRLWGYGERTRSLWAGLEDNALERGLEDWYAETLDAIKLSIMFLSGMPDATEEGKKTMVHDWQSMESDMSGFAYDGRVLADSIWQIRRLSITRWWLGVAPRFLGGILKPRTNAVSAEPPAAEPPQS